MIYFRLTARVSIIMIMAINETRLLFRLLDSWIVNRRSIDRLPFYARMGGRESVARDKNKKNEESLVLQCG